MVNDKKTKGDWGEKIALNHLQKKGYKLIKQNYFYSKVGEIDIIVNSPDGKTMVFVEVKAGNPGPFGQLEYWITPRKQSMLKKTAQAYIYNNNIEDYDFRFDAIIIEGDRDNYKIKHYENAF